MESASSKITSLKGGHGVPLLEKFTTGDMICICHEIKIVQNFFSQRQVINWDIIFLLPLALTNVVSRLNIPLHSGDMIEAKRAVMHWKTKNQNYVILE